MAKGTSRQMGVRILILTIVVVLLGTVANIGQLVNLQFINSEYYQSRAIDQQLSTIQINAARGTIYDRNMNILAKSATVWNVILDPKMIAAKDGMLEKVVEGLSSVLNIEKDKIRAKATKNSQYEVIASKVDKPVFDAVEAFIVNESISGVVLVQDSKRYYPYNNLASTVIGFTGTDNTGLFGIEAKYDEELSGIPGKVVVAKNAYGTEMPFDYETQIDPQDGNSLVLTIDSTIQAYAESALELAVKENDVDNRACVIVMDVKTGAILAMTTKPDFNLNDPFVIADPKVLARLNAMPDDPQVEDDPATQEDESAIIGPKRQSTLDALEMQWTNKALTEPYEPGSVFKSVTSAMALEERVAEPEERAFNCPGYRVIGGHRINCANHAGHGLLTFREGFAKSCNPTFIALSERIGATSFFKYFQMFGFTEKTGIDLPGEVTGIYHKEENLNEVELATSAFGQTFKVTPIQLITAMSAIANGGNMMTPYVVKQVIDNENNIVKSIDPTEKRQAISEDTSKIMREMLEAVVNEGGGFNAYIAGYQVGGKTGTSEKRDKLAPDGTKPYRISSFCGIAPMDDPQIAVLVILDEPNSANINGSMIAAPVARDIMEDVLPHLSVEPRYTAQELQDIHVQVPSLVGKSVAQAKTSLSNAGLSPTVIGNGDTVIRQIPSYLATVPKNGRVVIYTEDVGDAMTMVPRLTGLSVAQVNSIASQAGLNVRINGVGLETSTSVSFSQDLAEGTRVPQGSIITVEFQNDASQDTTTVG